MSADGCSSRPSMNNRHGPRESLSAPNLAVAPSDMPEGTALRPLSVEPERKLREEVTHEVHDGVQSRPWYAAVSEWRDWYDGYERAHIEFESPDGEIVRSPLENSYQPDYGRRYYAKLKDFERGVSRRFEDVTTVMLTLSASTLNANGDARCPADHMRDIAEGWKTARKQLHKVLSGQNWEYARVWEPTSGGTRGFAGYGHMHVAVFVEDDGAISGEEFEPFMRSYVENCGPAGWEAHRPDGDAVSVNSEVNNLGSYISEYIGIFGKEALERPMKEQAFYAVAWATNTRRLDFSNGAQEIISGEQFRRETGLRPEDRGGEAMEKWRDADVQSGEWSVRSICTVRFGEPEYADPTTGGVEMAEIAGREGVDPPPVRE